MATQNGVNRAIVEAEGSFIDAGNSGGEIILAYDSFEFDGETSGEVINLGRSFGGKMRVFGAEIIHDALGTGVTLKLGDNDDDDAIIKASAAASAGTLEIAIDQVGALLTGDYLVLTTGGAAATGTVKVLVKYINI